MSSTHLELLDENRLTAFKTLKVFADEGTLAGGTALSLQIEHRHSFDFDVFLGREIKRKDFLKLKSVFAIKNVEFSTADQLTVVTADGINITLLHYYYPPLFAKVPTLSLPLYAVKDIALDKALTIGRRAVWRDYVDLFFILKLSLSNIPELIELAPKKFGVEFNPKLFLEQLVFFKDLQITKTSFVKEAPPPEEIQIFLKEQAKEFTRSAQI
jgi:hypothetical protein